MSEEQIQEVLKDPNTWCWGGATYPEGDSYSEDFHRGMKDYLEHLQNEDKNT